MSELTEALIAIAKGGCECEVDECDGTCGPSIAERAAKHIAELKRERDELKAKLAEAENLLRTDSHGDIRSVFEMEGRAEKAEAERDGLKGQLARAETRERDLEVVNSRVEADYAELERERDEARAERDEGQKRIEKLDAALQFYAGRKREDGNGYEFDDEPSRITGGVARAALRAVLR